jgi:hypothetical protein
MDERSQQLRSHAPDDDSGAFECRPAEHTHISRAASQAALAQRMRQLCATRCRRVAPDRAPEEAAGGAAEWLPPFCAATSVDAAAAAAPALRWDHGCYASPAQRDHVGSCATAVFLAVSNASAGARFYGGCQEYVWEAVRQWRVFHPASDARCRVFLVVSRELAVDQHVRRNATAYGVELVELGELATPEWRRYERVFYVQGYMHPCGSRATGNRDFNKLVSARFFLAAALMRARSLRHVVIVEGDVMVYANMTDTVRAAARCGWRMATTFPHHKGAIPGVVYVRAAADAEALARFINDVLSCGRKFGEALTPGYANDMTYLLNFFQMRGGAWMGDLPNYPVAATQNCVAAQLPRLLHDGASFGQWYSFAVKQSEPLRLPPRCGGGGGAAHFTSGCDTWEAPLAELAASTRDNAPVSTARPPLHIANAMKGRFVDATPGDLLRWRRDAHGRRVPFWRDFHIASLHVHAKNLWWFRSV